MQLLRGKFHKTGAAFTLIELLIVISIVALLTALATNNYLTAQKRSRDSGRKASVNTIAGAVETYYSVKNQFPGDPYVKGVTKIPPLGAYQICETYSKFIAGIDMESGSAPYYYYSPSQDCSLGTISTISGEFSYDPADYLPKGTWIPGLGQYLNPIPTETHFVNKLGGSAPQTEPTDVLDSRKSAGGGPSRQRTDPSFTLSYRNLQNGYLVYARLESTNDSDFNAQFTDTTTYATPKADSICLPTATGVTNIPADLSCLPTTASAPNNPIVLYLVRK